MTLFTKAAKEDNKSRDEMLSKILASTYITTDNIERLVNEQSCTNKLLNELIKATIRHADAYGEFINVIQNFFAIQKKLSIEESKRRAERDAEFDLTEADKKY